MLWFRANVILDSITFMLHLFASIYIQLKQVQPTWKEDADHILDWIAKLSTSRRGTEALNSEYPPTLRLAASR